MVAQSERSGSTIHTVLENARALFAVEGYHGVTVEKIARQSGVAKGAVYHHFNAKKDIFAAVVDALQRELAHSVTKGSNPRRGTPTARSIGAVVTRYLLAACSDENRRILLVDGPVVLGWQEWREIDDRYFGVGVRAGLVSIMGPETPPVAINAAARVVMGAVMEAALVCSVTHQLEEDAAVFGDLICALMRGLQAYPDQSELH